MRGDNGGERGGAAVAGERARGDAAAAVQLGPRFPLRRLRSRGGPAGGSARGGSVPAVAPGRGGRSPCECSPGQLRLRPGGAGAARGRVPAGTGTERRALPGGRWQLSAPLHPAAPAAVLLCPGTFCRLCVMFHLCRISFNIPLQLCLAF